MFLVGDPAPGYIAAGLIDHNLGALVHGLTTCTNSGLGWVQGFYWLTGGSFLFLFMYRVVNSLIEKTGRTLPDSAQR